MLTQSQIVNIMHYYLQSKLGADLNPVRMTEVNTSVLAQALQFYQDLCGESLSMEAIASVGESHKEHADQQAILFKMLDASLQTSGAAADYQINAFDQNQARQQWLAEKANLNLSSLVDLHANVANLGIAEKFLIGKLHGQEWLSDLDLQRLAKLCGLKDKLSITRLNSEDIGNLLHFKRRGQSADKPYVVPLILNKGSSGDISSQGSHWVSTMLHIDPVKKEIKVQFRDSMHMSALEQEKIKAELTKAIYYKKSTTEIPPKVYQAFPGFKLNFDMVDTTTPLTQADSWSCGYHAFKAALDLMQPDAVINAKFIEIRDIPPAEATAEKLRSVIYRDLLSEVEISPSVLKDAAIDNNIVTFDPTKKHGKINADYLNDYVDHVAKVKPNRAPVKLTPAQLQELKEIDENAEKELVKLEDSLKPDYANKKELELDLATVLNDGDSMVVAKTKIQALIRMVNKFENPVVVTIKNIDRLRDPEQIQYFIRQINNTKANFDLVSGADHPVARELALINVRNLLIKTLKIKVENDEDPWQEIWRNRISNGSLYHDDSQTLGELHLYSTSNDKKAKKDINDNVDKMVVKYLQELLKFLNKNHEFFQSTENGFPYKALALNSMSSKSGSEKGQDTLQEIEIISDWCEKKFYFPFESIQVTLPELNGESLDKFKRFLKVLNDAGVEKVTISMFDKTDKRISFNNEQFDELIDFFKQNNLTIILANNDIPAEDDLLEKRMALENMIVINNRKQNIKQGTERKKQAGIPEVLPDEEEPKKNKNIRPYKLKNFDVRQNLNTEVNVEQQLELQQQHQLQTQLSQEVQQEVKLPEQAQSEIDDSSGAFEGKDLINAEKYGGDLELYMSLITGMANQKYHRYNFDPGGHKIFWYEAFGYPPPLPKSIQWATKSAINKMHVTPQHFVFGINMDNLPEGFFVKQHENKFVLCFDETIFIENKNQSPLTVKSTSSFTPGKDMLLGDQRAFMPDNTAQVRRNNAMRYESWTLEKFYDLLHGLNEDPAVDLVAHFKQNFQWLLEDMADPYHDPSKKSPTNAIYPMVEILYSQGHQGLETLLSAMKRLNTKDPELYSNFKRSFINGKDNINSLLKQNNLNALNDMVSLSQIEKKWWRYLVAQHTMGNSPTEPALLYDGFQHFLKRLKEANIPLPFDCPLNNCTNMLVGLDRMLAILGKVHPRNMADQLENLKGLSFREEGAWYAARWANFHYFHPAMGLTADRLSEDLERQLLGRAPDKISYKVDYADLLKMGEKANWTHADYAFTLFHRYLGTASRINPKYQYYVDLIASLKEQPFFESIGTSALPVLALVTSGERGSEAQDAMPFFAAVDQLNNIVPLRALLALHELSMQLHTWPVIPNLSELTSLYKLLATSTYKLLDNDDVKGYRATLKLLGQKNSVATLAAMKSWDRNTAHLAADDFIALYEQLQTFDADNMDYLAKIAANLRAPVFKADSDKLMALLKQIKAQPSYLEIIKTLASIDTADGKTIHEKLPTVVELNTVLTNLVNKNDNREIFQLMTLALPDCKFNLASTSNALPQDFASAMQQSLDDFNAILKEYNIAPLEGDDLQKDIGKHIQSKLKEIETLVVKQHGQMVWNMVKDSRVYGKVMTVAKEAIFVSINTSTIRFPQLNVLREMKFPEPAITNKYESIGENIVKLTEYASNIDELFNSLLQLRSRWSDFDIDFLLNSPRSNQFSAAQMQRIFTTVNLIDISFIPASLLSSIFADKPFARGDGNPVDTEQLTKGICQIIEMQELNLAQRGRLIDIVTSAKDPAILNELVQTLKKVKEANPAVLNDCFNILESYYKENSDNRAITTVDKLLTLFDKENEVSNMYFHALSKNINAFLNISDLILEDIEPSRQQQFAKIIAYSCLGQEADASETLASEDVINKLAEFSKTDVFDQLTKLYQQRPYPRLAKLKQFLDLKNDNARQKFINDYQFDPPGMRTKRSNIESQFDVSTIDERIDSIRDLSRDTKNPLYFTERKTLKAQLAFVNSIGEKYNLTVPGISEVLAAKIDLKEYQKPVSKLTKGQIQTLICHYREVISKGENNSWDIELAKLEFVALAREAMYRTTSKFPYSTQVLSLLNVMMHSGNVISEIRTGEGKGCITALFAASKWMDGGAVDVCSSNMELAGRDLEEFNDYYEYLGIETKLVRAKTRYDEYRQDGINYSDVSELALFQQQCELLQLKLPGKASLVLDESDFATLDNTTQFRFATSLDASFDPHFNPHEWLYPAILEFVASYEFNNMENPLSKVEDIRALKKFVTNHPKLKNAEKFKFYKINDVQLDKWIDSAYTASKLVEGEDFAVRETKVIREGQSIPVQVARVKILHRENPDSSFSNGVHQFLHTRLNLEIDNKKRDGKKFPIEPEKTYLASKSAKNFVDYYTRRGNVLGLTGTVGSEQEVQELRQNYGFKFYKIPPHKPLVRTDHAPILATRQRKGWLWLQKETAKEAHFRSILEQVKKFRSRGQPILLFCDGVASSQELYNFILDKLGPSKLQLYNGEQLTVREKDATDLAGLSEMITITTPMWGRGNDFKPHYANGDPVIEGLAVVPTFISPDREFGQEIGRAGRNNAFGDTVLVTSEDEFYTHGLKIPATEAELISSIEVIKEIMTQQNFVQRRERQLFADIKDQFFSQYIQNCKMLKANVENFYQQARATGEQETWKPLQHECHLLWEQFLNKIDGQWNELVVGLHNELGKMDEATKSAAEEKLLREKISALTTFANKEWAETLKAIETTSNEKLMADYNQTLVRIEKTTNKAPSPEVLASATPTIQFDKFTAEAFKILAVSVNEEMPSSISYKPLDANDFSLEMVYSSYSGNATEEIKAIQFLNEINSIYVKVFNHGPPPGRLAPAAIVETILRKLFDEYHHAHQNGFPKTRSMENILRLMLNIGMYGDEKFKRVAYDVYTDHVKDHTKEPDYLFLVANDMYALRNLGSLPANAELNNQELLGMSDTSVWADLYQYANQQLDGYSWSLFKSADRGKTLDKLRVELAGINAGSGEASEKISLLVSALNKVSLNATSTDLFIDKQKGRWSIFSHRNVTGSRFQEMLTRVKDKAMSYGQIMSEPQLQNDKSIDYLRSLLQQLLERTRLVKIHNHPTVNKMRADTLLTDAIDRMVSKEDPIETQKDLLLILQHLKAYAKTLASDKSVYQDSSLTAYSKFTDDIIAKIKKYQYAEQTRELAIGERKSNFYTTSAFGLRESLQTIVEKLLQRDYIAEKKLNIKKFTEILPGDSEDFKLAQTVLFEMERKLKTQYGAAQKIEIVKNKTSYSNGTLIAGFKLTFKNHQIFDLPIIVRSLTKKSGKNDFAFVQVPEFQAATKAPVKSDHRRTKSLSAINEKETSPITTPKKPNKLI